MRIALGSDHAGRVLRRAIAEHLAPAHALVDFGTESTTSVDYPEFAHAVAQAVVRGEADVGILVCGTGIGMSIAANRVRGVRAALCTDEFMARMARAHNDANVLCIGERVIGSGVALGIVDTFLATAFAAGRHAHRVALIDSTEEKP